jgi:hypothetical protein
VLPFSFFWRLFLHRGISAEAAKGPGNGDPPLPVYQAGLFYMNLRRESRHESGVRLFASEGLRKPGSLFYVSLFVPHPFS